VPTMDIYQAGRKVGSKEFQNKFFITKEVDGGRLFWEADEEQDSSKKGGVFQVWILGASFTPMIAFASPDWRLVIDGIILEQGLYDHIDVAGRTVELHYGDYRFVCSFPATADQSPSKISELRPIAGKDDIKYNG
jgi:hypothetical protein